MGGEGLKDPQPKNGLNLVRSNKVIGLTNYRKDVASSLKMKKNMSTLFFEEILEQAGAELGKAQP